MHPKKVEDLVVSDKEIDDAEQAGVWFRDEHSKLLEAMIDQIARSHGMTEKELQEFREFRKNELKRLAFGKQ